MISYGIFCICSVHFTRVAYTRTVAASVPTEGELAVGISLLSHESDMLQIWHAMASGAEAQCTLIRAIFVQCS